VLQRPPALLEFGHRAFPDGTQPAQQSVVGPGPGPGLVQSPVVWKSLQVTGVRAGRVAG
jgi:hypothetical protein